MYINHIFHHHYRHSKCKIDLWCCHILSITFHKNRYHNKNHVALFLFLENYICMKITHVFSCKCRKKWCRYFNENSFDGYEYQTLNDYNPIINKLNDTDGKFVFQSDVKLLWGRTEKCLTWKHFTSVLYKKKNHHWMMNTIILSHQHKINYSSLHIQLPWSEDTNDSGAGNFQKKKI